MVTLGVAGDYLGGGIRKPPVVRGLWYADSSPVGAYNPSVDRKVPARDGEEETPIRDGADKEGRGNFIFCWGPAIGGGGTLQVSGQDSEKVRQ